MFKQTLSSLKYIHVVKWDSASHCLILIHIGSSRNCYLKWGIKELSCTHRNQINGHYTSAKVVRVVKWHSTQLDRPPLALQGFPGVQDKMRIWVFASYALNRGINSQTSQLVRRGSLRALRKSALGGVHDSVQWLTAEERKGLSSINREDKGLGGVRSPMKILELKQNIEHKLYKTRAPAHRSNETSVADVWKIESIRVEAKIYMECHSICDASMDLKTIEKVKIFKGLIFLFSSCA